MQVSLASSTSDSVVVNLVLSGVGTAPLTFVEVEFHRPAEEGRRVNTSLAHVTAGDTVNVTLTDLQDNTVYSVSFAVYNYGGKGVSSQHLNFTTGKLMTDQRIVMIGRSLLVTLYKHLQLRS